MRVDLFVIDGQNDFLASGNEPADWPCPAGGPRAGSLYVKGADQEALAVAAMLKRLKDDNVPGGHRIRNIRASLDSHPRNDCSNHLAWRDKHGKAPPPFTIVTPDLVKSQTYVPGFAFGVWEGKQISSVEWAIKYTEALDKFGRSPLCLWPPHCEIGTWGQGIYHPLMQAYNEWCAITGAWVDFITKGDWPWSEHYSALKADVPDPTRPNTQFNAQVVKNANEADIIGWVGWAGSHCLRWTALDAINHFGQGENAFIKKSVFFHDASASVPDIPGAPFKFSEWRKEFLDEVVNRGGTVTTTDKFLA